MPTTSESDSQLEIGHVLFMDVVGYSKLLLDEQREFQEQLTYIVRNTEQVRVAEAAEKLIRVPTGDGMALVFFNSPEAPVQCAIEVREALKNQPGIQLRMGIHSGPVNEVRDVNDRTNVAGAGINIAQRVMDCGDAGHILLSKRAAEDLAQSRKWQPYLHDLGECAVKHNVPIFVVNFYNDEVGNPELPQKFKQAQGEKGPAFGASRPAPILRRRGVLIGAGVLVIAAFVLGTWFHSRNETASGLDTEIGSRLAENIKAKVGAEIQSRLGESLKGKAATEQVARSRSVSPSRATPTVGPAADQKSIAVLPFVNMSADKGDEYLSDGVSEELIAALSKITGLQVKARTSSFAFKGKNEDIQKIGELLHVSHLLEGSVAKAGNKLRITAQLIQASDGNHLWSDTYDREMQDIFAVRSEVAQQVAETLKIRLLGEDKKRLGEKPTENIEAYNLYRQGRYYADKFSQDGFKKALGFYQQAIETDPRFALAYAGMADTYVMAADFYIPPREAFSKAKEAALKAIELDETLAEAHASLGSVHFHYDWDWAAAEKEFKRALTLNPQSARAHLLYTEYLAGMGRFDEAYDQGRQALEIDPVSTLANWILGWAFLYAGRIDDAIQQFSEAVELDPNDAWARMSLGRAYLGKGMGQRGIEEMEVAHRGEPDHPIVMGLLGYGYAVTGRRGDALKALQDLDEIGKKHYVSRIARVYVYAGLGDKDKAFEWLEKAYQERSDSLAWFRKDPESKSLQTDPRFAALMRKIGFTEP
jgi:adenylate cyclase